jgi:hypothetical protein
MHASSRLTGVMTRAWRLRFRRRHRGPRSRSVPDSRSSVPGNRYDVESVYRIVKDDEQE